MTKAQERALEMYPEPEFDGYFDDLYVTRQGQAAWNRSKFIEGYEQAEKDLIERACRWLLDNYDNYFDEDGRTTSTLNEFMVGDFKRAMEEE